MVIFKFCEGTLRERVATPRKWSEALGFSVLSTTAAGQEEVALSGLSQWLAAYLDAAIAQYHDAGNPLYADFAQAVTDPEWNGMLVLAADVVSLPDQAQGLMAGIDATQLVAHHFCASVTPVKPGSAGADLGISSLFGLVDYELPQYRQSVAGSGEGESPLALAVEGAYGFTVLQLQALFRNTALVDFRSRIQLTVKELFGAPVDAAYSAVGRVPATAVVLRGSYQRQGGRETYTFEQTSPTLFTLKDPVLQAVSLTRAQWDTLGQTGGGDAAQIASRFLLWGRLDFAALKSAKGEALDVLSFGSLPGTAANLLGDGLAFANLQIGLRSPAATPTATAFTFDASALAFDLAASNVRPASLFEDLSLQLDSFIAAADGRRPSDHGYLPIASEAQVASFEGPWYGVVCKLTLGGPGALVAKAGFESRLLLGWAPAADTSSGTGMYTLFVGIALPGAAPGAKLLSIQGVLKLSIASIKLLRQAVVGHPGQRAFVLQLRNVGIKFLGIAKLPPGATIDFFLFGALEGSGSLGWYAAYRKDPGSEELATLGAGAQRLEASS